MTRKQHSAQFEAKVVVEAIRGVRPVNELAARFGVHPVQIAHRRKQALEGLPGIFASRRGATANVKERCRKNSMSRSGGRRWSWSGSKKSGLSD